MVYRGLQQLYTFESPLGLEDLAHKGEALVSDDLLENAHPCEHVDQLQGDRLSLDVPERCGLGISCGIIQKDQ